MTSTKKILCFEYLIYSLNKWYKELNPNDENSLEQFSRLKSLKLLFFASAVNASSNVKLGLLTVFDNFYAMQHGPVESDIYNAMVRSETQIFDFTDRPTKLKNAGIKLNDELFSELDSDDKELIDNAIETLKEKNNILVLKKPFDLVDISHKWNSWKVAYEIAQIFDKRSEKINSDDICNDIKYFD